MREVSVVRCGDYSPETARRALEEALGPLGGLDWVKQGMRVAVKANLVAPMKPESAATTHPALLSALADMLTERGAAVVIGDSPGGPFSGAYLSHVYAACGLKSLVRPGVELNGDFSERQVEYPEGLQAKRFAATGYLLEADAVINFCKLKAHGMMGMSAAVKNLFGMIPGTLKPEYHYRYPNERDFADMLIDLNGFLKPRLCLVDAVVAMEGNGPTAGRPRKVGALLAGTDPYKLDLACAVLLGLKKENVPTLEAAFRRGLAPADISGVEVAGDLDPLKVPDFDNILSLHGIHFEQKNLGPLGSLVSGVIRAAMCSRPMLKPEKCIQCGLCERTCPAHVIEMKPKPRIDRKKCIHCFCCQEFCPKGALVVHRPLIARVLHRETHTKEA